MNALGIIVRLQVQERSLKVDAPPRERYDPSAIVSVPEITLSDGGAVGTTERGLVITDVHHRDHPSSKFRGDNGLSICTTAHYAAMRDRFGDRVTDGIAGENILVASDLLLSAEDVIGGFAIETEHGLVRLSGASVAAPCAPFSRFAMNFPEDQRPDLTVTETLRFLDAGMRGFYVTYAGQAHRIRLGDRVFLA